MRLFKHGPLPATGSECLVIFHGCACKATWAGEFFVSDLLELNIMPEMLPELEWAYWPARFRVESQSFAEVLDRAARERAKRLIGEEPFRCAP